MSTKSEAIAALHDIDDPEDLKEVAEEARRLSKRAAFSRFHEGQRVAFRPTKGDLSGRLVTGRVKSINKKTVTVDQLRTPNHGEDVPYGLYYRIGPASDWWEAVPYEGEEAATA